MCRGGTIQKRGSPQLSPRPTVYAPLSSIPVWWNCAPRRRVIVTKRAPHAEPNSTSGGTMFDQRPSARSPLYALLPSLRALAASAGILALALAICISVHHAPYAVASDSAGPAAANVLRSATDFDWRQSPSSFLNSPGQNSITLDPCPPGVIAAEPWFYVYISGAGTPEAARVTGGTCKGDNKPGTI